MERNTVHKFINTDGFVINSNTKDIKTSFKYIGEALNCVKIERLLMAINNESVRLAKRESKTELQYEQALVRKFIMLTAKRNPEAYLANYAKSVKRKMIFSNLTKDSFLETMRSNKHNVIDWDIQETAKGYNYAIKAEVFFKNK